MTLYFGLNHVREAKLECMPDPEHFDVIDYKASVDPQALFEYIARRLCELQRPVLDAQKEISSPTHRYKIGFHGSTGQSIYKQPAVQGTRDLRNEESLLRYVEGRKYRMTFLLLEDEIGRNLAGVISEIIGIDYEIIMRRIHVALQACRVISRSTPMHLNRIV